MSTRSYEIRPDSSRKAVTEDLAKIGAELMVEVIRDLDYYADNAMPQYQEDAVTYGEIKTQN